jgi:error-prone DNA polymerase
VVAYAELQVTSNYSFLVGASHPEELVETAAAQGHAALAITDRSSLAGVVRGHVAAKRFGLRLVVGARLDFADHPPVVCLPTDRAAYGRLTRLITLGRRRAPKGQCDLVAADLWPALEGQILLLPAPAPDQPDAHAAFARFAEAATHLAARHPGRCHIAATRRFAGGDLAEIGRLAALAAAAGAPLVATNDVHHHAPARRALADVMTAIRLGVPVAEAGWRLALQAERHLKPPAEMARLFQRWPEAVARSVAIAEACRFGLDELAYEYPEEITGGGRTPQEELVALTWRGAATRWPDGVPEPIRRTIDHELALIDRLNYGAYFLTVHDIVAWARDQGILCQGRGSAANSVVCYALGVTAVDPVRVDLLFERFVSAARDEPPDIDVDFEHERREEVIQYIYGKYGRERAGLAASVNCYRGRGALREVAKAMGLSADVADRLTSDLWGWGTEAIEADRVIALGLDPASRPLALTLALARELIGHPRHLSQHVGGFVLTRGRLDEVVPVTNAAMAGRTVIEWDKDDLDALRILKVDVLALGMLTAVRKAFALVERHHGRRLALADVPPEDPAVYDMICRADTVGVFQIESRAQMSMLPRLKPRCFYDLVIEVAIVRPGPIQGDMVHPYLRRRRGEEPVTFPSEALAKVLGKTLGVPLFQEQAMRIAIVAAGFTPEDADRLRRAMATFRRSGDIHKFGDKLIEGMVANGYERDFAERCFRQIEGFGTYGFPESHAASFALLVYVSCWLKHHHPAAFCAALLNSQPLGFYAPAQLVRDARDHGVVVRPPCVAASDVDSTLEPDAASTGGVAIRLGLRLVKGLSAAAAARVVAGRAAAPWVDAGDLARRGGLGRDDLSALAAADAFAGLAIGRRAAGWVVGAPPTRDLPLFAGLPAGVDPRPEPVVDLPAMPLGAEVLHDYRMLGLSLRCHPMALLRRAFDAEGVAPTARLARMAGGRRARVAGLVLVRQRPGSAHGTIFMTVEDDQGVANLIIWPSRFEELRRVVMTAALVTAEGEVQRDGIVVHLLVDKLTDRSDRLAALGVEPARVAADVARALARADEVARPPPPDPRTLAEAREFRRMSRDFR